jgi:hypothetical protein
MPPRGAIVQQPRDLNHEARSDSQNQVKEQIPFEPGTIELKAPREDSACKHGNSRERGNQQVVVGRRAYCALLFPLRDVVEQYSNNEKCDRENGLEPHAGHVWRVVLT